MHADGVAGAGGKSEDDALVGARDAGAAVEGDAAGFDAGHQGLGLHGIVCRALGVIRRRRDHFAQEDGEDVVFVPLVGRFGRALAR